MTTISDQLRSAIERADELGLSRYRICQKARAAGHKLSNSTLSRFLAGGGIGSETIDALQPILGLEVTYNDDVIRKQIGKARGRAPVAKPTRKARK